MEILINKKLGELLERCDDYEFEAPPTNPGDRLRFTDRFSFRPRLVDFDRGTPTPEQVSWARRLRMETLTYFYHWTAPNSIKNGGACLVAEEWGGFNWWRFGYEEAEKWFQSLPPANLDGYAASAKEGLDEELPWGFSLMAGDHLGPRFSWRLGAEFGNSTTVCACHRQAGGRGNYEKGNTEYILLGMSPLEIARTVKENEEQFLVDIANMACSVGGRNTGFLERVEFKF